MKVLHIIGDFDGSEVHKNLIKSLDRIGVEQTVYVPINYINREKKRNLFSFNNSNSNVIYSDYLSKYHRLFFKSKIKFLLKDLLCKINNVNDFNVIYSSTWCSDGSLAYEINRNLGIPYVLAIRDTDINIHYKYFFWYRTYFNTVIDKSSRIIFLSEAYRNKFNDIYPNFESLRSKIDLINNGLDKVYLENIYFENNNFKKIRILSLGAIIKRKNYLSLVDSVLHLRSKGFDISLDIIGAGFSNRDDKKILNKLSRLTNEYDWLAVKEFVNKDELIFKIREYTLLAVPSLTETFGLIYLEALSQGLPIIYSKNQGFDGEFEDGFVGFSVNPYDIEDISNGIESVIRKYDLLKSNILKVDWHKYNWDNIANIYKNIFNTIK